MIKKGVWEVEGAAFWCHILRPGTLMSLITHELFLLPRLRKRRHYHEVSVLCGVPPHPWNAPRYFCFTQRAVWRRACPLSACCCSLRPCQRISALPGSSTCLPWSCSHSAPVGDCFVCEVGFGFISADFMLLLHEVLVVLGSPVLLSRTDVGLAVGFPHLAAFPLPDRSVPRPCAHAQKIEPGARPWQGELCQNSLTNPLFSAIYTHWAHPVSDQWMLVEATQGAGGRGSHASGLMRLSISATSSEVARKMEAGLAG